MNCSGPQWRRLLLAIAAWTSTAATAATADADLYQYYILTAEWLVDNSDLIVVVRGGEEATTRGEVVRTIKGNPQDLHWPLKPLDWGGYSEYAPPADGPLRLLFVRGSSELLGAVQLHRQTIGTPTIHETLYGVTHHGKLLLSESDLMQAIAARQQARRPPPVSRKSESTHFRRSGIDAAHDFPLECGDETFVLVVTFDTARRDHYIKQLETGDAARRIHAIRELSQLNDAQARQAIEAATRCEDVAPSHFYRWDTSAQATENVRKAAQQALGGGQ